VPRRPRRSQNRSRPTRREIERELEAGDGPDDLPQLTVSEAINYTVEEVRPGVLQIQETGELRRGDTDDGGES
jgi:hypothetical protein